MEAWQINSIHEHQDFSTELEKLNELKLQVKKLKQEQIPKKEKEHEVLKRRSIETEKVSWHEVQESKQELERLKYKLFLLEEKMDEQSNTVEMLKSEARNEVNDEAKAKMLKAVKKAIEGYEMIQEASNEFKAVRSKQLHGLKLTTGERRNYAIAPRITVSVSDPSSESINQFWYKRAKEYIAKSEK